MPHKQRRAGQTPRPRWPRDEMRKNKTKLVTALLVVMLTSPIITGLGLVIFKRYFGYYPIPFVVKKVYYSFKYQSSRHIEQVVDTHFRINTAGYKTQYELKNMLNMPYYVYVKFNPKIEPVPASYQFTGQLNIIVTRDNAVQYSHITKGISKVTLGALGAKTYRPGFTDGYYVAVLPFPLKNGTYNNTKLSITVTGIDNNLMQYAETAQISIFPEIDLDSDVSDYMLETGIHNY
jgi:hypothetical protein